MAKYELTIRGITKQFNTAEEMAQWRETMLTPTPKFKKKFKNKKSKVSNLNKYIAKNNVEKRQ